MDSKKVVLSSVNIVEVGNASNMLLYLNGMKFETDDGKVGKVVDGTGFNVEVNRESVEDIRKVLIKLGQSLYEKPVEVYFGVLTRSEQEEYDVSGVPREKQKIG
jgi:hypothetical protein